MIAGIDVSSWQGVINWHAVKAAGYHYAFIRASRGSIVDAKFVFNFNSAKKLGY